VTARTVQKGLTIISTITSPGDGELVTGDLFSHPPTPPPPGAALPAHRVSHENLFREPDSTGHSGQTTDTEGSPRR
jgi:hypothetical protein